MASHGTYEAHIVWERRPEDDFLKQRYSRAHLWHFDGGVSVPGSPSPFSVRAPWSDASAVDPEEAFVAAISSCHMLTFLYLAAKQGFAVASYDDRAIGVMSDNAEGNAWVSRVTLRPVIVFDGETTPDAGQLDALHHHAHEQCYIANSVRTEIVVDAPAG